MASDAHAHPHDLLKLFPGAEAERRSLGIACAASSCTGEEFSLHEMIAIKAAEDHSAPLFLCFAVHPQLPAFFINEKINNEHIKNNPHIKNNTTVPASGFQDKVELLAALAEKGRISAVGETGFDLFSEQFRETEQIQDGLFAAHLEIARRHNLPLILHVRKAMHKIFPYAKALKSLPAVIFHSWPGAPDEGFSLIRRGIRAYFSFGTTLLRGHKNAIRSCAAFPPENLLLETDAPYQPLLGKNYSSWADLPLILDAAAKIRKEAGAGQGTEAAELEQIIDGNFFGILAPGTKPDPVRNLPIT